MQASVFSQTAFKNPLINESPPHHNLIYIYIYAYSLAQQMRQPLNKATQNILKVQIQTTSENVFISKIHPFFTSILEENYRNENKKQIGRKMKKKKKQKKVKKKKRVTQKWEDTPSSKLRAQLKGS